MEKSPQSLISRIIRGVLFSCMQMKSPSPKDHIACQSFQRFVIEALGVRNERTCTCLAKARDMICQWYPALAPQITAFYAQGIEFQQALLDSFQNSESLYDRIRWFDEEENARPDSSSELFSPLDPSTTAVDKNDSMLASPVQREDLDFAPCLEASSETCIPSSKYFQTTDDQTPKIHFQGTRASMGVRPRRTVPPQLTVCTNLRYKDGADQERVPQRAVTYDRKTLVQSIDHSSDTLDGRSPTLDFELSFHEVQAARRQITLPGKLADRAVGREKEKTRGPDDNKKVGIQNKKQGQKLRKSTGRYELKDQVDVEEGARDDADGEEAENDYEDDSETVDADPDLMRENKLTKFATRAIADSIVRDRRSSNHQSNKRAHQDAVAESPLSKRSKLTAHVDIECQTPSTTTTSTKNSFGESFLHKYDMKYKAMCNHSPRVKAVDIWRCLSTNISSGRSRSEGDDTRLVVIRTIAYNPHRKASASKAANALPIRECTMTGQNTMPS